jgi:hypothetical protein
MHVHANHMNPNAASLYSAAEAAKAAATRQAADVRKKLLSEASKIAGQAEATGEGIAMIGQGTEEGSSQRQGQQNPRAPGSKEAGRKQVADEDQSDQPLSTWA